MNYLKIYNNLIYKAKARKTEQFYHSHHIIPKCLGGKDDKSNLVNLTPEEHLIAHKLLLKINKDSSYEIKIKLVAAVKYMSKNGIVNNKKYGWLARYYSEYNPMRNIYSKSKMIESLNFYYATHDTTKICPVKFCKQCGNQMRRACVAIYCSMKCKMEHPDWEIKNKNLSKIHKTRFSIMSKEDKLIHVMRSAGSITREQKDERNKKISSTKALEYNRIQDMNINEFYSIVDKFKIYRTDGHLNGNLIRWLKIKDINKDEYISARINNKTI